MSGGHGRARHRPLQQGGDKPATDHDPRAGRQGTVLLPADGRAPAHLQDLPQPHVPRLDRDTSVGAPVRTEGGVSRHDEATVGDG